MISAEVEVQRAGEKEESWRRDSGLDLVSRFTKGRSVAGGIAVRALGSLVGLGQLDEIQTVSRGIRKRDAGIGFFESTLAALGVTFRVSDRSLAKIPSEGPVLLVANHPFGILDGLMLGAILERRRKDFKIMLNYLLTAVPELREWAIPLDPLGGRGAASRNAQPLRAALALLRAGGCVATFPAGKVSRRGYSSGVALDGEWSRSISLLSERSGAAVVPVWFGGENSFAFHAASWLHPRLGMALLVREALNKRGLSCRVEVGQPVAGRRIGRFENRRMAAQFMRLACYALGEVDECNVARVEATATKGEAIAKRDLPLLLADEVDQLPADSFLFRKGHYAVYIARAEQIPLLLREIGRSREETFRPVGEGTGKELDLDDFDGWYRHLFVWDEERCAIVGAYRLAFVDEVLRERGPAGLYCNGLYELNAELLGSLGPAIELGRSFVAASYQRDGASLSLLWRGIGELVGRSPRYTTLFGAVSLTDSYRPLSKLLMIEYLKAHKSHRGLWGKIRARIAPRLKLGKRIKSLVLATSLPTLEDVSALVSNIEPDGKGVPILLKHYLRLNGLIASFGIDQGFNDALDGFVVVDLLGADRRLLKKYLGPVAFDSFCKHHGIFSI